MRPATTPLGLRLTQVSRVVSRAFDEALAAAGGSLPVWLVLLNLKARSLANQRALAEAMGIREATLTHHLNAMEGSGLVTRQRDPANRRVHVVTLTAAGEETFVRLRAVAIAFDRQLRRGVSDQEAASLSEVLGRLAANVGGEDGSGAAWAGLAERRS